MKMFRTLSFSACVALVFGLGAFNNAALCQSQPASTAAVNKSGILHVSRSSTLPADTGGRWMKVWGTIDGSKVELTAVYGGFAKLWVVAPGDYPVRMTRDEKTDRGIVREYEVELMPGKHQAFYLSGVSE